MARPKIFALPAFLSALLLLLAPPAEAQSVNARNQLKIARSHAEAGEWGKVKEYTDRALKEEPGYVDALYMRAFAHRELGDYGKAEADFKEVIRNNPDYLPTYGALAETYMKQEQYDKADQVFVDLSQQPHGSLWANYYRGVVAYLQADLAKAEKFWKAAIGDDVNFAPAHHNLGALYLAQGEPVKALAKFREALSKKEETTVYRFHIAWALERAGQPQEARQVLAELIEDSADDQQFWLLSRALDALIQNKPDLAVKMLETVAESHPDNLDVWVLLGRAHLGLKNPEKAREALKTAKKLDSAFVEVDELMKKLPAEEEAEAPVPEAEPVPAAED